MAQFDWKMSFQFPWLFTLVSYQSIWHDESTLHMHVINTIFRHLAHLLDFLVGIFQSSQDETCRLRLAAPGLGLQTCKIASPSYFTREMYLHKCTNCYILAKAVKLENYRHRLTCSLCQVSFIIIIVICKCTF